MIAGYGQRVDEPTLRWAEHPDDLVGALAVRERVFCDEQGVSREDEVDGRDAEAAHLIAREPGGREVIATLRVLVDGSVAKIGRVAVERAWRRRGLALRMLEMALEQARGQGCERASLAAQVDAIELYRRVGFAVESAPFEEAGITHVWMGSALGRSRPGLRPGRADR
jgi:predicted GNAT family N-acyltransferase